MYPGEIIQLEDRTKYLGNHYHKYTRAINDILPEFYNALSENSLQHSITIQFPSQDYSKDMTNIIRLPTNQRSLLDYLGCYYAIQFLWFNLYSTDWLTYHLTNTRSPQRVYKKFILQSGINFRKLTAAYMQHLLEIFREGNNLPEYVITGVGTRSDQEDIDVGIIDDNSANRFLINRIIGKMSQEMIRFASNFHFHLSEHVGNQTYSASIQEYENLLDHQIGNFVILTEMLSAAFIIGSQDLFITFQKRIIDRYFYHGSPNHYHEGYLRGILGEIIDLSAQPLDPCQIHPKQDGLRIIKNLIYAYKSRLNIQEVNPWQILNRINKTYPNFKKEFRIVRNSLSFLEIFRYLYQLLVVQEETIPVKDEFTLQNLQRVAYLMGYRDYGPHLAVYHLLHDYKNHVQRARNLLPLFIRDLSAHLLKNSVFRKTFTSPHFKKDGFALLFKQLYFFQNVHFWDDFFELLLSPSLKNSRVLKADLTGTADEKRDAIFTYFSEWVGNNPHFLFKFALSLNGQCPGHNHALINQLVGRYFSRYQTDPVFLQQLVILFHREPCLFYNVLEMCNCENLRILEKIVFHKNLTDELFFFQKSLAALLDFMIHSSHYFRRFVSHIFREYSCYACSIWNIQQIEEACTRILCQFSFATRLEEKKQLLGNYYDLKFVQIGIKTIEGTAIEEVNRQYTEFITRYFRELFKVCMKKILKKNHPSKHIKQNLAIYASGGMGRGKAFEDDFDLIFIADFPRMEQAALYREIIALMNTEIIKRGTLPHFRFSEHFGEYFCPYQELKEMLTQEYPGSFIDKSQLLEARLLVGNPVFHQKFLKEIIDETIFKNSGYYIEQMICEMDARHSIHGDFQEDFANIKECTGGLRDIEMIILIYKTKYRYFETNAHRLIQVFCDKDKNLKKNWFQIWNAMLFLQRFRYLHRLIISAEDDIYARQLGSIATKWHEKTDSTNTGKQWLWQQFVFHRREAWHSIQRLIQELN